MKPHLACPYANQHPINVKVISLVLKKKPYRDGCIEETTAIFSGCYATNVRLPFARRAPFSLLLSVLVPLTKRARAVPRVLSDQRLSFNSSVKIVFLFGTYVFLLTSFPPPLPSLFSALRLPSSDFSPAPRVVRFPVFRVVQQPTEETPTVRHNCTGQRPHGHCTARPAQPDPIADQHRKPGRSL